MNTEPVNLTEALASFDAVYSPRIVARMNDYDVSTADRTYANALSGSRIRSRLGS